ncbi:MAG: hypothetical protein AB7U82_35215 [Blastocatellales bacterium]
MQTGTLEITGLPLETLNALTEKAKDVGATVEEYARLLIEQGLAQEAVRPADDDSQEVIEGIREGLESMRQGNGTPAREFFANLRNEVAIKM